MKNLKIFLAALSVISLTLFIPRQAKAVNLGPFSVTIGFCQQVDKLAAIVNSTTIVEWPVTGFPGVTVGMLTTNSAIMDFCQFLTNLETMNTTSAIFYTGNYLNTLTDNKWKEHFQQADRTWNIANTLYDFESGKGRKGAMSSASTYRELNDYVRDSYKWSNKTFNNRDAELKTRGQREADMQKLAGVAYQRAIIKEMMSCPTPDTSTDYGKLYEKQVGSKIKDRDQAQEDYLFYKQRLYKMGPKIAQDDADLQTYIKAVEAIEANSVTYDEHDSNVTTTTYSPSPTEVDADSHPVQVPSTISRVAQNFKAVPHDEISNQFRNDYSAKWKSWVTAQVLSSSQGLFTNASSRVQNEFRDLSYECAPNKVMAGIDPAKTEDYDIQRDKKINDCRLHQTVDGKEAENLLNYYATEMYNALLRYKQINATMWTVESTQLGRNRVVTSNGAAGFEQEQIKCSQTLTPAEMDKLAIKQQAVNNDLTEMISKASMEQAATQKEEMQARAEAEKNASLQYDMVENKKEKLREQDIQNASAITPMNTGIGARGQ